MAPVRCLIWLSTWLVPVQNEVRCVMFRWFYWLAACHYVWHCWVEVWLKTNLIHLILIPGLAGPLVVPVLVLLVTDKA